MVTYLGNALYILKGLWYAKDVIFRPIKCPKSKMKHCNNHLELLSNINIIQQKEIEAWMDKGGQD